MKQKPATTNNKGFNTLLPETTLSGLWKTPSTTDDSTICFICKQKIGMLDCVKEMIIPESRCISCRDIEIERHGYNIALSDVEKIVDELFPKCSCVGEVIAKDCPKTWIECWSDGLNNEIKEEIAKLKGEGK